MPHVVSGNTHISLCNVQLQPDVFTHVAVVVEAAPLRGKSAAAFVYVTTPPLAADSSH